MNSEPPPPEGTALGLMRAMTRLRARLRFEAPIGDLPVTWSHLTVLHRIVEQGQATATELAHAEHVRRQSMAETLNGLRSTGLITDGRDPNDGRKVLVSATEAGRAVVERSEATREAWLSKAISGTVTAEERRVLDQAAAIMDRLADAEV
ncbi:MarR family transcriptional regulator [Catenulispora sp. NL8]|uniref:MarR family transcriptional regulator n=1 Tax=Catenulispora pinistramenti TaxID=2705254 RepID=A0ABS5L3Q1_9ACTN|nr:MarR family transcriptional regulator [Catenulispora pinistramenti]MBS2552857.1 MarR family transcriptional regulator [Catenulispora pinistramenti]